MQLGLSENLSALVAKRFTAAKEGGHLIFSPTQLSIIQTLGIPFQLRYCPALAKKPTATPKPEAGDGHPPATTKKPDPFENPSPELLIAQIPAQIPAYNLVLNKFPVIPDHFILATREWKSQTDLLEKGDLEATYACVKTWAEAGAGKRLFAFFNTGEDSGASQPHRHIQFLPVEAMMQQEGEGEERSSWRPLIDVAAEEGGSKSKAHPEYRWSDRLPCAHFALPLPSNPSAETLHAIYLSLYRAAVAAAATAEGKPHDHDPHQTDGEAVISHNLAMTESAMMICPRRNESASISLGKRGTGAGDEEVAEAGVIALNGTILAGTLMVKAEAEWNELRRNPEVLGSVLAAIGYPADVVRSVSSL